MSSAPRPGEADWREATFALAPRGLAWPRDPESIWGRLLSIVADERRQRHDRALTLLDIESFPSTAVDLLPEWERLAGLPDPCRPAPGTLAQRRVELIDQLFGDHAPTKELMLDLAVKAGWDIEIHEQQDFVAGLSMAGEPVGESDFVWIVHVLGQSIEFFRAGQNAAGDVLFTFPDISTLECVLRRAAPAHTSVHFVVPDP
jgi:uncharacterized protein YmfQ (DUF2313 family)